MAFNEELADRVREIISLTHENVEEKKMFGGVCFMVDEKMCLGIIKENLMARIDPEIFEEVLEKEGCEPMDFTGKSMKGFVFVDNLVLNTKPKLEYWVKLALEFNPHAKKSVKKKSAK
jgi:TfoX/Sxy family transcriptional regulator of competence genes